VAGYGPGAACKPADLKIGRVLSLQSLKTGGILSLGGLKTGGVLVLCQNEGR
jgi:hypothetical protein